jgi:hypothetical protein
MVEAGRVGGDGEPGRGDRLVARGQPVAGAMFTVGSSVFCGGGSCGRGPVPAASGSVAVSPQPARAAATRREDRRDGFMDGSEAIQDCPVTSSARL